MCNPNKKVEIIQAMTSTFLLYYENHQRCWWFSLYNKTAQLLGGSCATSDFSRAVLFFVFLRNVSPNQRYYVPKQHPQRKNNNHYFIP